MSNEHTYYMLNRTSKTLARKRYILLSNRSNIQNLDIVCARNIRTEDRYSMHRLFVSYFCFNCKIIKIQLRNAYLWNIIIILWILQLTSLTVAESLCLSRSIYSSLNAVNPPRRINATDSGRLIYELSQRTTQHACTQSLLLEYIETQAFTFL